MGETGIDCCSFLLSHSDLLHGIRDPLPSGVPRHGVGGFYGCSEDGADTIAMEGFSPVVKPAVARSRQRIDTFDEWPGDAVAAEG